MRTSPRPWGRRPRCSICYKKRSCSRRFYAGYVLIWHLAFFYGRCCAPSSWFDGRSSASTSRKAGGTACGLRPTFSGRVVNLRWGTQLQRPLFSQSHTPSPSNQATWQVDRVSIRRPHSRQPRSRHASNRVHAAMQANMKSPPASVGQRRDTRSACPAHPSA